MAKEKKKEKAGVNPLFWALAAAVAFGLGLRFVFPAGAAVGAEVLEMGRSLYLAALKLVVGPVVFGMIASSVAGVSDYRAYGRIGGKVVGLYMLTSALAVAFGLGLGLWLQPGRNAAPAAAADYIPAAAEMSVKQAVQGMVPDNLFRPFLEANMLQILFLAVFLGAAAGLVEQRKGSSSLRRVLELWKEWFLMAASLVLRLMPAGMFCAVGLLVLELDGAMIGGLVKLLATVLLGAVLMLGLYGLMFGLSTGKNPGRLLKKCGPNLLSFALLCSTSAVMPQSLRTCEKKLGIDPKVSAFSMPLGSTINMDGACIYLTVSALFLAQMYGLELTAAQLLPLGLTTLLLSVGAPPVPGAGFICLSVLMSQLGLPMEGIGLLLGIDSVMSALRTAVNGAGDFAVTAIVASSEGCLDEAIFDAP